MDAVQYTAYIFVSIIPAWKKNSSNKSLKAQNSCDIHAHHECILTSGLIVLFDMKGKCLGHSAFCMNGGINNKQ